MSSPLWRQLYNGWERAVSPSLQDLTASTGFRDLLAVGLRANADLAREVERASRQWLHLWNLPAASDVTRLRSQVAGLERELVALRFELERREAAPTTIAPATAPTLVETDGAEANGAATTNGTKKNGTANKNGTKKPGTKKTAATNGSSKKGAAKAGKTTKGTSPTPRTKKATASAELASTNGHAA